jgi:tRNA pseudouridine55 synthase
MINGILNVNKPEGWTSQDVCAKLRSRLHIKKIGHTGTLDPMATGVLPICIGKATRIIEYYDADYKSYHAEMKLGLTTDTLDITGEILETASYAEVTENAGREAFKAYTGMVKQIPPKYSALRVDGKRAYELAREGKDFELAAREIEIVGNEITSINLQEGFIEFDVTCSKGTYIRTMIDDIGRALGCGAAMTALVRTGSGYFKIEDAYELEELIKMSDEELEKCVISMDETLINLGKVILDDNRVTAFINGNPTSASCYKVAEPSNFKDYYRAYSNDAFLGIAVIENNSLIPKKVITD